MTSPEKENPRSSEHLEAQRNRILDASEECFIKHGFHAASMARIASTAGISQGLAYRYFKNKSAIILAIIERQLERRQAALVESEDLDSFVDHIVELVENWSDPQGGKLNPVLFMEMCSEASRDEEIREAMATADKTYLADFTRWIRKAAEKAGKSIAEDEIQRRFFSLQAVIEGAAMISTRRRVDEPVSRNASYRDVLRRLAAL